MAEIKKPTLLTVDEAVTQKAKAIREGRFQDAMILGDLVNLLAQAEVYQTNEKIILSNPRSMSRTDNYCRVWQLVEDLSFQAVPETLRGQIQQLENELFK
ncbi:hypothetical protein EXT69_02940 [Pantoea agglomerans]|uniref:hypothetical protein n=1 Tax=Enterobacter agglomerans TaxID=549 RepID=UPI00202D1243|nr:hypothetical protein [Pantoea agglomerans]MCL6409903.1 hypothetical protein [Pantoea agglomerans]